MKKTLSIFLAITTILSSSLSAFAATKSLENQAGVGFVTVTITDLNTGETLTLSEEDLQIDQTMTENDNGIKTETVIANISLPSSDISPQSSVTDGGCTTRIELNIDYEQSGTLYRMKTASGSFTVLDNAFTHSNRMVKLANYDWAQTSYIETYYPSSSSFSYSPFTNWIDSNYPPAVLAGYAKCTVSRGGSSWEVKCEHTIISNGSAL